MDKITQMATFVQLRAICICFFLGTALAAISFTPIITRANPPSTVWTRHQHAEGHMGTRFVIIAYATDEVSAELALQTAFARIAELDELLSHYLSDSELNKFCAEAPHHTPVRLNEDLWTMLSRSQELARRTQGAFDVTVGPLTRLWRRARRQKELPSNKSLQLALSRTGYEYLRLDMDTQSGRLELPGMQLDLGAIAKGFAADEALLVLRRHGLNRASVDAGGDFALGDPPPEKDGWRIAIASPEKCQPPKDFLTLANQGVATSGDLWQFVEFDGKRYSHIVDPRTGLGLTTRTSATVIADDCTTADSLASAVVVLGPAKGIALIDASPGTAALIVTPDSERSSADFFDFR